MAGEVNADNANLMPRTPLVCRWLFGPKADICMFFAPVVFAPIVFQYLKPVSSSALLAFVIAQGLGLAPFHIGTTWYHLSNKRLRKHFFANRFGALAMLPGAAAILALTVACNYLAPTLLYFVYLVWTVQHLAQQNLGILRLFHNQSMGDEAIASRETEVRTIHSSAWLYSLVFGASTMQPGSWQSFLALAIVVIALIDFVASVWRYFSELVCACRRGRSINQPAQLFWMISITVLSPLALVSRDYNQALMIPLVVHWFQYIGLNIGLIKNKYAEEGTAKLTYHVAVLLAAGLICMVVYFALGQQVVAGSACHYVKLFSGLIFGIGIIHYVQDAFLWRFRDPLLRQELLAHLKPPAPSAQEAIPVTELESEPEPEPKQVLREFVYR